MPVLIDESPSKRRPTQFSADTIIRPAPQPDRRLAPRGHRGARRPGQQAHRVPQAQGHRRPHQLLASRRLLHPRPTRPLRRARPVVLSPRSASPARRHSDRNRRDIRQSRRSRTLRRQVGQSARCRHPGRATQARRRRAADTAQARRPVLYCAAEPAQQTYQARARRLLLATPVHPPSVGAPGRESALETVRRSRSAYSTPSTIARET